MSIVLALLPLEPGRKHRQGVLLSHYGGGWWQVECLGDGKRCAAGTCRHTASLRFENGRRVKPVPRRPVS